MIIYSLSKDQSVVIGGGIVVRVVEVLDDEVVLEIDGPDGVQVRRGERYSTADPRSTRPMSQVPLCCG